MKITLLTLLLALSFIPAKAQKGEPSKPKSEIPTVSYCEMIKHPDSYAGKEVRFRALFSHMFEMSAFSHKDCKGDEVMAWVKLKR